MERHAVEDIIITMHTKVLKKILFYFLCIILTTNFIICMNSPRRDHAYIAEWILVLMCTFMLAKIVHVTVPGVVRFCTNISVDTALSRSLRESLPVLLCANAKDTLSSIFQFLEYIVPLSILSNINWSISGPAQVWSRMLIKGRPHLGVGSNDF